jgi:hypothetical protein
VANLRRSHDATGAALGRLEAAVAPAEPPPDTPPEPVPPTVPPEPTKPPEDIFDSTGKLIRKKQPLPAAKEWRVSQTKHLIDVYRHKAGDGDHIVLAPDVGFETLDMDRSFDPRRPLVIRSESERPWSARFEKALRFNGPGHWLHEVKTVHDDPTGRDSFAIKINADHVTITRCWLDSPDGIVSRDAEDGQGGIGYFQIGWNIFTGRNRTDQSRDHILFLLPLQGDYRRPEAGPHNGSIHRNLFWDPLSNRRGSDDEDRCIYFGHTKAGADDLPMMQNVFIDYNLFHKDMRRNRVLYMKRGCVVRRNQADCDGRNFGIRHGAGSKVWGNRVRTGTFHFSGARGVGGTAEHHHDIRGNVSEIAPIELYCGSDNNGRPPQFQAASFAELAGNEAPGIVVGAMRGRRLAPAEGGPVKGVKIWLAGRMHRSKVQLAECERETVQVEDGPGPKPIPEAITLTETDVGLGRPLRDFLGAV